MSLLDPMERVRANWRNTGEFYHATIRSRNPDGTYEVSYKDGDKESSVPRDRIICK